MLNPYEILTRLKEISGSKAKIKFLKKHDSELLRNIIKGALDPRTTYGVKQYDFSSTPAEHQSFFHEDRWMWCVLTELSRRSITGGKAQEAITKASNQLNEQQRYVFARILDKDLKCGVSVKTANKAFPDLIPVWEMQKAANIDFDKVTYPCIAEIKENGRGNNAIVVGREVTHHSNEGRDWEPGQYFNEELIKISGGLPVIFFGEVRGRSGKGVDQYKASQTFKGKNPDMSDAVFVIWDMLMLGEFKRKSVSPNRTQAVRSRRLREAIREYQLNNDQDEYKIRFIKQRVINSKKELIAYYNKVLRRGGEGLIVKNMDATYKFTRNNNWMKLKESNTADLKIVAVKQGKSNLKGTLGSVTVKRDGVKVDCPMGKGVTRDDARRMWKAYKKDKKTLIGRIAEVSYQNVTPDGSLFLPKFLQIREDKTEPNKPEKKTKKKVDKKVKKKKKAKKGKKK